MPMKPCKDCGSHFYFQDGEQWKLLCLDCWKESKRRETGPATYSGNGASGIDERIHRAVVAERDRLRGRLALMEARLALSSCQPEPMFDRDDLRALRRLCHPDRHNGSEAATRMSQKISQVIARGTA